MIKINNKGDFDKTYKLFKGLIASDYIKILEKYGREGVNALSLATPVDSGKTASSWDYHIKQYSGGVSIVWTNSNVEGGSPIAILIQYGHATKNNGYVEGRDYINPALLPVFDKVSRELWEEVTKL